MPSIKLYREAFLIFFLICSITLFGKSSLAQNAKNDLIGTEWFNDPYIYPNGAQPFENGDSLFFYSDDKVEYFIGSELSFYFTSDYSIKGDTLILKTKLQSFEVADASNLEPNLIEKYLISPDTLYLFYRALKRNGVYVEGDSTRYTEANSFVRIR